MRLSRWSSPDIHHARGHIRLAGSLHGFMCLQPAKLKATSMVRAVAVHDLVYRRRRRLRFRPGDNIKTVYLELKLHILTAERLCLDYRNCGSLGIDLSGRYDMLWSKRCGEERSPAPCFSCDSCMSYRSRRRRAEGNCKKHGL